MGFIEKFILPKEVDFVAALKGQLDVTCGIVRHLCDAGLHRQAGALVVIGQEARRARELKNKNMQELLDVFITPYDKEAIYRLIVQLDWVVLSVRHFVIEREVYGIEARRDHRTIFHALNEMATLLEEGFKHLAAREMAALATTTDLVHDKYDQVVEYCARAVALLFQSDNCKTILMHKDLIAQLKEIAKRMHISATTLEDMAIKAA